KFSIGLSQAETSARTHFELALQTTFSRPKQTLILTDQSSSVKQNLFFDETDFADETTTSLYHTSLEKWSLKAVSISLEFQLPGFRRKGITGIRSVLSSAPRPLLLPSMSFSGRLIHCSHFQKPSIISVDFISSLRDLSII